VRVENVNSHGITWKYTETFLMQANDSTGQPQYQLRFPPFTSYVLLLTSHCKFVRGFSGFRGHQDSSKPQLLLKVVNIGTTLHEGMVRDDVELQGNVGLDPVDDDFIKRHPHARQR
jgi:hypothetical protein